MTDDGLVRDVEMLKPGQRYRLEFHDCCIKATVSDVFISNDDDRIVFERTTIDTSISRDGVQIFHLSGEASKESS